jgi:hypothetical protein
MQLRVVAVVAEAYSVKSLDAALTVQMATRVGEVIYLQLYLDVVKGAVADEVTCSQQLPAAEEEVGEEMAVGVAC